MRTLKNLIVAMALVAACRIPIHAGNGRHGKEPVQLRLDALGTGAPEPHVAFSALATDILRRRLEVAVVAQQRLTACMVDQRY